MLFGGKTNLKKSDSAFKLVPEYLDDVIKIHLLENGNNVPVDKWNNLEYQYLINTDDIIADSDNACLLVTYESIYNMEFGHRSMLGLPEILEIFIYVENDANFMNRQGVSFRTVLTDGFNRFEIVRKNLIRRHSDSRYFFLSKSNYDLVNIIREYNSNSDKKMDAFEQYNLLEEIRNASQSAQIVLNETLRNESQNLILNQMQIDFIENDNGMIEAIPSIKGLSEEENKELAIAFRERGIVKNFYEIPRMGKKIKLVFNKPMRRSLEVIKKQSEMTVEDFINRKGAVFDEIEDENVEIIYGPRVIGLGYLNYRPTPPITGSDLGWFEMDFPRIFTDEDSIQLKPEHLPYLEDKLRSDSEQVTIELDTDGGRKKLILDKKDLSNELEKLKQAILPVQSIKNLSTLEKVEEQLKVNPDKDYVEVDGKYYTKPEDPAIVDALRELLEEEKSLVKEKSCPADPQVLITKSNIEEVEYEERVDKSGDIEKGEIPLSLLSSIEPMEHQLEGLGRLQTLYKRSAVNGMVLSDDMGLGKTLQILMFMAWLIEKEPSLKFLVVTPTLLLSNWSNDSIKSPGEIEKFFAPGTFRPYIVQGKIDDKDKYYIEDSNLVLISYESLRMNQKFLGRIPFGVLVCDEAQKIKNPKTLVTTAVKAMNAQFKIACTATPIENTLDDLWCVVDLVKPGLLGSLKEFQSKYSKRLQAKGNNITDEQRQQLNDELVELLGLYYIRRTKDELGSDFPLKRIKFRRVQPTPKQNEGIQRILDLKNQGEAAIALIQSLIALCSHPALVSSKEVSNYLVNDLETECNKVVSVKQILDDIQSKGEKVLIFTRLKKMQEILYILINKWYGLNAMIVNGEDDTYERREKLDRYKSKDGFNVIILSPEAAGVGVNIVEANHVIHYTRLWNPAKEDQATDRAYRIGQTKDVTVYYPIVAFQGKEMDYEEFSDVSDWIKAHITLDTSGKSPEEKQNKLIVRKQRLLRDFFLAAMPGENDDNDFKEFADLGASERKSINMNDVVNVLPEDISRTALLLAVAKSNGDDPYCFVNNSDYAFDGLLKSKKGVILLKVIISEKEADLYEWGNLINQIEFFRRELKETSISMHIIDLTNKNSNRNNTLTRVLTKEEAAVLLDRAQIEMGYLLSNNQKYTIEQLKNLITNTNDVKNEN